MKAWAQVMEPLASVEAKTRRIEMKQDLLDYANGKEVKAMLSLELIGIFGLLFGFVVYVMVVTQLERRSLRVTEKKTEAERLAESAASNR